MKFCSLRVGVLIAWLLLGSPAFAGSTATIVTHIDKPELFTVHAPRQMNLDLVLYLKDGVRAKDFEALRDWLTQEGFRVSGGSAKDQHIAASGNVDAAESAFQVQIMMTPDGRGYGPPGDAKIPSKFGNVVQSIVGLSPVGFAPYRSLRRSQPTPTSTEK